MSADADRVYLRHIVHSIERIDSYLQGVTRDAFLANMEKQDAVLRQLAIIGEAARRVSGVTQSSHSDIPWSKIIGMRHRVIHDYFGVDIEIAWETCERFLPGLKDSVHKILAPPSSS